VLRISVTAVTDSSISIAWSGRRGGTVGYRVFQDGVPVGSTSDAAYTFRGLLCNTTHVLGVASLDAAGNQSVIATVTASTAACAAALDIEPPSVPQNVHVVTTSDRSITIAWSASTDNVGIAGYGVYNGLIWVNSTGATSYTLVNLPCGTGYMLAVDAYDSAGNRSVPATLAATTAACATAEPPAIAGQGYQLVLTEDFNTFNRSVWDDHIFWEDPPPDNWPNYQSVHNGELDLMTSKTFFWGPGPNDNWPTNNVTTLSSGKKFQYGYFEARMKWTGAGGAWPAFWLYGYQHSVDSNQCTHTAGEIDIMEGQGVEPNTLYGTVHSNTNGCSPADKQNANNWQPLPFRLADSFHTYAVLWTSTTVTWFVDDKKIMSAATYATDNEPMYVLLSIWTGGWSDPPDNNTPDLHTEVDWVHVWQK
jgi:beta-glucanase (GH16 family)